MSWPRPNISPPAEAARLGLSGRVFVVAWVDETGAATDAVAASWNDPMFVEPVLAAARTARFSPEVIDCAARRSVYAGWVGVPVPAQRERVDAARFFPGTWACGDSPKETWRAVPGGVERVPGSTGELYLGNGRWKRVGPPAESVVRRSDASWALHRDGAEIATAHPWIDEEWTFVSGRDARPAIVRYRVTGNDSFERATAGANDFRAERCTRVHVGTASGSPH